MLKTEVENLLKNAFEERQDLFLIELVVTENNKITITIDGDNGVTVNDCVFVSRAVEHNLDRETQDFSLEVTSAGAATPLTLPRQYKKNIGRKLKVKTTQETFEGTLKAVEGHTITLAWKAREPKPIGKGKITVQKQAQIALNDVEQAKVVLKF